MRRPWRAFARSWILAGCLTAIAAAPLRTERVTVATYNLENYLVLPQGTREAKTEASRARVVDALLRVRADLLALQEVGGRAALEDLRTRLGRAGLDYPYGELTEGYDTNIQVAFLSRFPLAEQRSHSREYFLVRGRRYRTTRGIAEVDVVPRPGYRLTALVVHLKSRRETGSAPQEEIREQEAQVLRRLIDTRLRVEPNANLVVLGDFNDDPNSLTLRTVLGRGRLALVDTRPTERNGDRPSAEPSGTVPRRIAWTHFYGRQDIFSRSDYVLVSPGLAREWDREGSYVLAFPDWGVASDHRPVVVSFLAGDR